MVNLYLFTTYIDSKNVPRTWNRQIYTTSSEGNLDSLIRFYLSHDLLDCEVTRLQNLEDIFFKVINESFFNLKSKII